MRAKNICAFSLAEMMVVMLILSIVAAATLPIITRRSHSTDSIWQWASNNTDAYFGLGSTQGAVIGSSGFASGDATSKLMINTSILGPNHIMFKQGDLETGHLVVDGNGNVGFGDAHFGGVVPPNPTSVNNAVAIGKARASGDKSIAIGYYAIANATTIGDNPGVAIGSGAYAQNGSVAIGPSAKAYANEDTAVGYNALGSRDSSILDNNNANTAIGYNALGGTTSSSNNTAVGDSAMYNNGGNDNVAVGYNALYYATSAESNVAIGSKALYNNLHGSSNIGIGQNACSNVTGSNKICIGDNSGPQSGTTEATDTNEDIYIGSKSKFNNNNALLEVHNLSANRAVVIVNGDFVVRGRTFLNGTENVSEANPPLVRADSGQWMKQDTGTFWTPTWATSDRRLKNVGSDFNFGINKIRELHVYNYTFKKDKTKYPQVGVMAQDLKKVFPDAVSKGPDGYFLIRKEDMFYAMINSIKQLDKIVQGLVSDVKAIAIKVQKIDDKIAAVIKVDQINSQKIKKLEAENAQLKTQNKAFETRLKRLEQKVR